MYKSSVSTDRRCGVLLHPTSLPSKLNHGDIGHEAYRFIEFLHRYGFKNWQMLPLGPTLDDKSPYQSLSAHAANSELISLDWLEDREWLTKMTVCPEQSSPDYRSTCLQQAGHSFYQYADSTWLEKLDNFTSENQYWLEDYALFMALKGRYHENPWYEWPLPLRHRELSALNLASKELQPEIKQLIFEQFIFFTQWQEVRDYAHKHEIEIFGDMPIFMAKDCADVWAYKDNFLIDVNGNQPFVAGVPPDAFSETGQHWGNPLYDWEYMQLNDFDWWKNRFKTQLNLFDLIRVDHFRGLQACWYIPAEDDTAINGSWKEVPGDEMLTALFKSFESLPLIAEDLGVITQQVIDLKNRFKLPGMKVLQFAFDGNNDNPHLPHRHKKTDVVYTGTHDNDTTLGWLEEKNYHQDYFLNYIGCPEYVGDKDDDKKGVDAMIRLALSSVSFLSILPMQDLLLLDSSSRMNIPGTVEKNWLWQFHWEQLDDSRLEKITELIAVFQR